MKRRSRSSGGTAVECSLTSRSSLSSPASVAVMVVHNKDKVKAGVLPDNVVYIAGSHVDDCWVCYPWDAHCYGMSIEACDAEACRG